MGTDHIIENGGDYYRETADFHRKENEIRTRIDLKYKSLLTSEKNGLKRIKLRFQKARELRKALSTLNSKDILFLSHT